MDGDRRGVLKSRSGTQFKKKGANKKGKWSNFGEEFRDSAQVPNPSDTVYRILCPSRKIGSVIGKGGGIVKALREKTRSKITVSDSIPGSDERVIMIYSPPDKISMKESDEGDDGSMPRHCPAQDALMKVHDRIIEEELSVGTEGHEDKNVVVTARLLVPNNMVGCLLGKGGDVIQRLRSETGASIRVLPAEHLPSCALSTDELVQIQGKPMIVKKALYEVSTLLHENPRKEQALNVAAPFRAPGFLPGGPPVGNMPPPRDAMWSPRDPAHMPPPPWMDDYAGRPGFMPGGFDDGMTRPGVEPSGEFSMKILCLASKIGGVIGKGGINVRQLELETGTSIHVEDPSISSEERIIRVSAFETLRNPRSQTIDAILLLQNKVSEVSEKGTITTRLLVPSSKVGCLLGQGGSIINEMRRRTQADIRVYSKDEKPKFASDDEELVQVSGSFAIAKDALGEIASRLRARCLRDGAAGAEPAPSRPVQGYGPMGNFPRGGPPPIPGPVGVGSVSYDGGKGGGDDYEPPRYPILGSASRYPGPGSPIEVSYHNSGIGSTRGPGGIYSNAPEAPGSRMKVPDAYIGRPESMIEPRGGSDRFPAVPSMHHDYGGQNHHPNAYANPTRGGSDRFPAMPSAHHDYSGQSHHPNPYPNPNGLGTYPSVNPAPPQVSYQSPYQNPYLPPYQQSTTQLSPYKSMNAQPNPYQSVTAHGTYQY